MQEQDPNWGTFSLKKKCVYKTDYSYSTFSSTHSHLPSLFLSSPTYDVYTHNTITKKYVLRIAHSVNKSDNFRLLLHAFIVRTN